VPEALARSDHDFVLSQTVRPRRAAQSRRQPSRFAVLAPLLRNPGRTIVGAASAALAVGIVLNALAMQEGRHPAPFFRTADAPLTAVMPATTGQAPAMLPPVRPATLAAAPAAPSAEAARQSRPVPAPVPAPASRDAIGDILRGGGQAPAADANRTVVAGQRALNKLNYGPLKADGLMGAGTRAAIERFERDRKLPVTGEIAGRTARELAAASGMALD
jgi:hypothetical protein